MASSSCNTKNGQKSAYLHNLVLFILLSSQLSGFYHNLNKEMFQLGISGLKKNFFFFSVYFQSSRFVSGCDMWVKFPPSSNQIVIKIEFWIVKLPKLKYLINNCYCNLLFVRPIRSLSPMASLCF